MEEQARSFVNLSPYEAAWSAPVAFAAFAYQLWHVGLPAEVVAGLVGLLFVAAMAAHFGQNSRTRRIASVTVDYRGLTLREARLLRSARILVIPWGDVRASMYDRRTLSVNWGEGSFEIVLTNWVEEGQERNKSRAQELRKLVPDRHPIFLAFAAHTSLPPPPPEQVFRLDWSGVTAANAGWMVLFTVLVLYAAYTPFGYPDGYVDDAFVEFCIKGTIVGLLLGALAVRTVVRNLKERIAAVCLMAAAMGWASYAIALQMNGWEEPYVNYEYEYLGDGSFQPVLSNAPAIRLRGFTEYLKSFPSKTTHTFALRKGSLGFYQLNIREVEQDKWYWFDHRDVLDTNHTP